MSNIMGDKYLSASAFDRRSGVPARFAAWGIHLARTLVCYPSGDVSGYQ